jgi:DNA primase
MTLDQILEKFEGAKQHGKNYLALCPAHTDGEPSLSISQNGERVLMHCFSGCKTEDILAALGLKMSDLFINKGTYTKTRKKRATVQPLPQRPKNIKKTDTTPSCNAGASVQALAELKKLPANFLAEHGLSDAKYPMGDEKIPAVRISYFDEQGQEKAVKFRIKLTGKNKHRWRKSDKAMLYGLDRIDPQKPYICLVEGESDYWTLAYHGFNALALPGAGNWNESRDAGYFGGFGKIYVIIEPDAGGEAVLKWLEKSTIKDRAYLVTLDGYKDPSELHCAKPDAFRDTFFKALDEATPFEKYQREKASEENEQAADTIIPLDFFLKAREKPKKTEIDLQQQPQQSTVWGADIARYGADKTCLCKRQGDTILLFKQRHGMSTMDSASWIALECKKDTVCVDEVGVGAGTFDKLSADGFNVVGVNVARAPRDTERFANKRAELFWQLREKFEKSEIDLSQLDRKTCDQLQHQITSIRYKFARGKLLVESKENMKKRGLPSPDMADALVLSYATDAFNVNADFEIKTFRSRAVDYNYWFHQYD